MKQLEEGIDIQGNTCWYGLQDADLVEVFTSIELANEWLNS